MRVSARNSWGAIAVVVAWVMFAGLVQLASSADRAEAATNTLNLNVVSARTEPLALDGAGVQAGDSVTEFRYMINVDNTGTTGQRTPADGCSPADPGYPDSCLWTSIASVASSSPIVTQGDESDFATGGLDLPEGKYLISVMADGYKLDGAHFTVPLADPGVVTVELQPTPLPTATVRALVFEDVSPTNGAPDVPAEDGLAGFQGQLVDYLGELSADMFGNPLCTTYQADVNGQYIYVDGAPVVDTIGGRCLSDANGLLEIPNVGPNRYGLLVVPPDGSDWTQTTTLEGNLEWDTWVMEGSTGYDTEFVIAGEPVPTPIFGFVRPTANAGGGSGVIRGVVDAVKVYVPASGGLNNGGTIWGGLNGGKIDQPIENPWISLTDLQGGDTAVYIGQGNADGSFEITGVPDGNYTLTWWDEELNNILDLQQVSVQNGETVDLGVLPLTGWWSTIEGHIYIDANENGKRDPGEQGVPQFPLVMKKRENSGADRAARGAVTDSTGYYSMTNVYPMTQWMIIEAYSDLYYTTGITYQADNQPAETTILGAGVDLNYMPIIGLGGRIDWGVKPYAASTNGGIVGSVTYDTTRAERDPAYGTVEDWQPGISGLTVNLYLPVDCGTTVGAECDELEFYELAPDGSYAKGDLINQTITESWEHPGDNEDGDCVPRNVDGAELTYPTFQQVTNDHADCLEGPLMAMQFQAGFATVDGNYGFGDACFGVGGFDPESGACADGGDPELLDAGEYLVEVVTPSDIQGRPIYTPTREEDVNVGDGDDFVIPQVPPASCAGAFHTVDVDGYSTDGFPAVTIGSITVPESTPVHNPTFADAGTSGSIYEGQQRNLCDTKIVTLQNQRSTAPGFNFFTEVPIPARFWGLMVDDLNFSADPASLLYGEKAGVPFAPVGIYDFTNRLVHTVETDYNGLFDVLLPSTTRVNCPTPSGVCANMYRLVGNDPGVPGRLNLNYKPQFRTIAAEFEAYAGLIVPVDLAPTQVGVTVQLPTGQAHQVSCALDDGTPQLFAVSKPYVHLPTQPLNRQFTIQGIGFGNSRGAGGVDLDGTSLQTLSWSDTEILVRVPNQVPTGSHQLNIVDSNGVSVTTGLTFHVLGAGYMPNVYEVGPGRTFGPVNSLPDAADHAIQNALDAAATSPGDDLVVVYPGESTAANPRLNPLGAYYENLILTEAVKLQGVGPGGIYADGSSVPGSVIDAGAFGGDSPVFTDWWDRVVDLTWDGPQAVADGAGITVFTHDGDFDGAFNASIDGFQIRGGNQQGFPGNLNIGGAVTEGGDGVEALTTQGGAIFANAYARNLQISNNLITNNGGAYGAIRIGTPNLPDSSNENVSIRDNRIVANGGTNLAGAIGLFAGSDGYAVTDNHICGNFSAEYGGGVSVYGYSPDGTIDGNRIWFNASYDEGGGVMIAGELPANPTDLSPGSGPVDITNNVIQANLANDDGGGIRFLMAGDFEMNVVNNTIVNNISTHEGGGIALNDAPDVRIVNNTIANNLTTATALTSNGLPAPAGVSTVLNSDALQATLAGGSPLFSDPLLFNNVLWDNRAGTRAGGTVLGLGLEGDATPINRWDMGVADGSGTLSPTDSWLQTTTGIVADGSNVIGSDPQFSAPYEVSATFVPWRTNPNFVGAIMVAVDLPPSLLGDYHLRPGSGAENIGAASKGAVDAPAVDIDGDARPAGPAFEAGSDETAGLGSASMFFSTAGNGPIPGVSRPYDNADAYVWHGPGDYSRLFDASAIGLAGVANVDAMTIEGPDIYLSFNLDGMSVPGLAPVQDEDIVKWDGGGWSLYFDGSAHGMTGGGHDIDGVDIDDTDPSLMYFSMIGNATLSGVTGPRDDADVYVWDGTTFSKYWDATDNGLAGSADIDGLSVVGGDIYASFLTNTTLPGLGLVEDEDVAVLSGGAWSIFFDGTAEGFTTNALDLDAVTVTP